MITDKDRKDAAKRVLREHKETKQHELNKDNKNADNSQVERALEVLKGRGR